MCQLPDGLGFVRLFATPPPLFTLSTLQRPRLHPHVAELRRVWALVHLKPLIFRPWPSSRPLYRPARGLRFAYNSFGC